MNMLGNITPKNYEIIKLVCGSQLVGMVIDDGNESIRVVVPMSFSFSPEGDDTKVGFHPYQPLSSEMVLLLSKADIIHRSKLNPEFVPFYDQSAASWVSNNEDGKVISHNKFTLMEETFKGNIH